MGTKNNPGAFDCYAHAEPDEPMFVLLGRDPAAGTTVRFWAALREHLGGTEQEKLDEAFACAAALEGYCPKTDQVEKAKATTIGVILQSADERESALREENEALRVELDAALCDLKALIGRVRRFEVTLEDGRVVILYGRNQDDALSRLPDELPEPPAYAERKPRSEVARVEEVGGEREDGTMGFGPAGLLVTDTRKAPGS